MTSVVEVILMKMLQDVDIINSRLDLLQYCLTTHFFILKTINWSHFYVLDNAV